MALKFYGTMMCPDCVDAHKVLEDSNTPYEFVDITGSVPALKEFTFLRDSNPVFDDAKAEGYLGIPAFVTNEDPSTATLNVQDVVQK